MHVLLELGPVDLGGGNDYAGSGSLAGLQSGIDFVLHLLLGPHPLQHRVKLAVRPSRTAAQPHFSSIDWCRHISSNGRALSGTTRHVYHDLHASASRQTCCLGLQNCSTACLPRFACFIATVHLLSGPPELQHNMFTMICMLQHHVKLAVRPSRTAAQHVYHGLHASAPRQTCRLALQNCSIECLPCFACFTATVDLLSGPSLLQHSMSAASALLQHLPRTAAQHLGSSACDVHQQCFERCCLYNGSKASASCHHCYKRCHELMQSTLTGCTTMADVTSGLQQSSSIAYLYDFALQQSQ